MSEYRACLSATPLSSTFVFRVLFLFLGFATQYHDIIKLVVDIYVAIYVHTYLAACVGIDTGILVGLTEGTYFNEGKVVVYYNGTRGAVCGDGWNDTDAGVVCKQLGFGSPGIAIPFGGGSESVLFGNVTCNGREPTLASCGHGTIRSCTHSEDAGVICLSQGDMHTCIYIHTHIILYIYVCISYNMGKKDLPDIYILTLWPAALELRYIYIAKQKHLGVKKCGANQKQHSKQAGVTKRLDIS